MRDVRKGLLVTALTLACLSVNARAEAFVVTFDNLIGDGLFVPDGYGGILWNNQWKYFDDPFDPYSAHSLFQRIYNQDANGNRNSGAFFDFMEPDQEFQGAWLAGYPDVGGVNLVGYDLYDNNVLVWSSVRIAPTITSVFLPSGYAGPVDRVAVFSSSGNFYVLDDITYTPTPEPGTMVLIGSGLLGLARKRRRLS